MSSELATGSEDETETPLEEPVEGIERAGEDDEQSVVEVVHAPPKLIQAIALAAALVGVGLTAPFTVLAMPFGFAGFVIVAASLYYTYSRGWLTIGIGLILVGALITGAYGVLPPELWLVGIGATIIAWDAGQHGMVIGDQLGRQAQSKRNQLVHVAATTLLIGIVSTFVYLVSLIGGSGRPASAVALVVVGVILLAWVFRS